MQIVKNCKLKKLVTSPEFLRHLKHQLFLRYFVQRRKFICRLIFGLSNMEDPRVLNWLSEDLDTGVAILGSVFFRVLFNVQLFCYSANGDGNPTV